MTNALSNTCAAVMPIFGLGALAAVPGPGDEANWLYIGLTVGNTICALLVAFVTLKNRNRPTDVKLIKEVEDSFAKKAAVRYLKEEMQTLIGECRADVRALDDRLTHHCRELYNEIKPMRERLSAIENEASNLREAVRELRKAGM